MWKVFISQQKRGRSVIVRLSLFIVLSWGTSLAVPTQIQDPTCCLNLSLATSLKMTTMLVVPKIPLKKDTCSVLDVNGYKTKASSKLEAFVFSNDPVEFMDCILLIVLLDTVILGLVH